jgi:hypothetical protein
MALEIVLIAILGAFMSPGLAAIRATVGFFPVMVGLGALHSQDYLAFVPPISWWASWLLIFVVALFLPMATASTD